MVNASAILGKEEQENYQLEILDEMITNEKTVNLTIVQPEDEEIIIHYENFEFPSIEKMNEQLQIMHKRNKDTTYFIDTDVPNELMLRTEKSEEPLSLSWDIQQMDPSKKARITLSAPNKDVFLIRECNTNILEPSLSSTMQPEFVQENTVEEAIFTNKQGSQLTEKQQAANDKANAKANFDPLLNVQVVRTYNEFKSAYADAAVTKIILDADISGNTSLANRRTSIEIDGNGHLLYLGNYSLSLHASGPLQDKAIFHLHDVIIDQNIESATSYSFVGGSGAYDTARTRNWYFRFGNLSNVKGKSGIYGVARVARGYYAEITVYGTIDVSTSAENFYVGSMIYEEDTQYRGEITYYNYSIIWHVMETPSGKGYTGESMEHTIQKNATVYYKDKTNNHVNYPAVYSNFKTFTVDEGASFSANINGNAFALYYPESSLVINKNAVVTLVTQKAHAVLSYCNNNTAVIVNPGGSLFVSGMTPNSSTAGNDGNGTIYGLIDFRGRDYGADAYRKYKDIDKTNSNRRLILKEPKAFDFKNTLGNTSGIQARVMEIPNNAGCQFQVIDSDISLWKTTTSPDVTPDYDYLRVDELKVNGRESAQITSSDSELAASFRPNNIRRITGMNAAPEAEWIPFTDADMDYGLRVKIGTSFDGIDDETGQIITSPIYAGKGQAQATFVNSYGETVEDIETDEFGDVKVINSDRRLNQTNQTISAEIKRGPWTSESEKKVIDVTPPEPAKVESGKITNAMKQIKGTDNEPEAKYFIEIYDESETIQASISGVVESDGTFVADLPRYLDQDEVVVIYLEDNVGLIPEEVLYPPPTNSESGNKNPKEGFDYRDTHFPPAAKYEVEDVLPDQPYLEKKVESVNGDEQVHIDDELRYSILVKNNQVEKNETNWKNIQFTDELSAYVNFDSEKADVQLNDQPLAKEDYHYDTKTHTLTASLGDLSSQESVELSFKVVVNEQALGQIIENVASAKGESPREKQFVMGPEEPTAEREIYTGISNVAKYPNGVIDGPLEIVSFPEKMDFGKFEVDEKETFVNDPDYSSDLIVRDRRIQKKEWYLTVALAEEMMLQENLKKYYLEEAIRFRKDGIETPITNVSELIFKGKSSDSSEYNITESEWSEEGDGFVLRVKSGKVKKVGDYHATLTWHLTDAYQGGD
jgi:fimbrial isopeptide formation D2 family protein